MKLECVGLTAILVCILGILLIKCAWANQTDDLINQLCDRDVNARFEAGEKLLKMGEPAVQPLIAVLKSGDPIHRRRAASTLAWIESPKAVDALISALEDENAEVRRTAADSLGIQMDKRAVAPLIKCLQDKDSGVRLSSVRSLGFLGDPQAVDALIKSLGDPTHAVKVTAAASLAKIGDNRAFDPLMNLALNGDVGALRAAGLESATGLGANAVEQFIALLENDNIRLRQMAVTALEDIGDVRAVQPLIDKLDDSDPRVRVNALVALGKLGDERAIDPIVAILKDPQSNSRATAASALGLIGRPKAVPFLITALGDEDPAVRSASAWALSETQDERIKEPLLAAVKSGDINVATAAYRYYIRAGVDEAVPVLIKVIETAGDKGMADDFAHSGSQLLADAGRKWISNHGYKPEPAPGMGQIRWGSAQ